MSYGGRRYGGATFAGSSVALSGAGGITFPGYDAAYYYYWSSTGALGAYGGFAYGGRSATITPAAGLFAVPDVDNGVVSLATWWAFASVVNLTRIGPDGTRTPVRGASPAQLREGSRRNSASNPKARDDLTGYEAGSNATLSRLSALSTPSDYVTTAVRATASAADDVTVRFTLDAVTPWASTQGMWVRTSDLASEIFISVDWYSASSDFVETDTFAASDASRTDAVGQWSWVTITPSTMNTRVVTGVGSLVASGLPADGTLDFTGRIVELGDELSGDYFDGDFPGAAWLGSPGLSFSDRAPITALTDGEAPLDVPVYYELTNPLAPGSKAITPVVTLSSQGRRTWLTHPASPYRPVQVEIVGPFGPLTRGIEQGVYYPLDSVDGLPIVRTQNRRRGRQGTVKFLATSHAERDRYLGMFADGSPVLIRPPATYGEGSAIWMSLGELTEDQAAYFSQSPFRTLSASFYEVAAPLTSNEVAA